MKKRSFGVTALAFNTVLVAIYSQYAAASLLLTGSTIANAGSAGATIATLTGVVFLVVAISAYAVAVGLWARWHWSWNAALGLYVAFFVVNLVLSILAMNLMSAVLPTLAAIAAVLYLHRTGVRAELHGPTRAEDKGTAPVSDGLEVARSTR
jgi:hypothetical protein